MKPTTDQIDNRKRHDSFGAAPRDDRRFPVTDFHYHTAALYRFSGGRAKENRSSFLNISRDYFHNEARHNFALEAAFFALMVVTVLPPLLNNAKTLTEFVRAIGAF
jgi:hypothetical protein